MAILSACGGSQVVPGEWQIYHNRRFDFSFPYPSDWLALPIPDNLDGRGFTDPSNLNVEIIGWAQNNLPQISPLVLPNSLYTLKEDYWLAQKYQQSDVYELDEDYDLDNEINSFPVNFTTERGVVGWLQVEIGIEVSVMKLTIEGEDIIYYWQGQANSEEFDHYYRLFYYIASQYRVPGS